MDSITQLTLGAAVGEAVLGEKVGRRAMLWGAVVGTVPDLDVAFYPLMDEIAQLSWHRGISHSLLLSVALAPAFGWVLHRINKRRGSTKQWTALSAACLLSAVLLDCFTVYGTQIFQPFSNYQVGFNSISIIDPIYTVPLLVAVITVLFLWRKPAMAKKVILAGLIVSTAYLGASLGIKAHVTSVFVSSLERQGYQYERLMTTPTLFNTVLWRATAEQQDQYVVGYYSLFDARSDISFRTILRNDQLLSDIRDSRAVQRLQWFSNGWYRVQRQSDSSLLFSDLRFGEVYTSSEQDGTFVFTWRLTTVDGEVQMTQLDPQIDDPGRAIGFLWNRLLGR
ncbi:metal-dependent hydrolase [candidate division GN15 bacterium]|nr:metal-dependent hydrolase [candidate division GN15 bacterium]